MHRVRVPDSSETPAAAESPPATAPKATAPLSATARPRAAQHAAPSSAPHDPAPRPASDTVAQRAAALWRAATPVDSAAAEPAEANERHAGSSWEHCPPRAPLLRWRAAASAVLVLAVAALTWWAVSWLNTPVPVQNPTAPVDGAAETGTVESRGAAITGPAAGTEPTAPDTATRSGGDAGSADLSTASATGSATVQVHVVGAVERPGVVRLPADARVRDAVERAGGAARGAQPDRINLAAPVQDGQQILVPDAAVSDEQLADAGAAGGDPAPVVDAAPSGTDAGEERIDLNRATATQLQTLPGVGPATAESIIAHREQVGPFASLEDLDAVSGIGPATLEKLRDRVTW